MGAKSKLKHAAILFAGWGFILLGILGLFLPILQGILFLLVGLLILSSVSPRAARLLHWLRRRFPRISDKMDEAAPKAKEVQRRLSHKFGAVKSKAKAMGRKISPKKRPHRVKKKP
ncbi:MAG TPA: PGPGW domain-containing protein [Blastocatellia bacterium]|nr:PGPGW domain-containing protein [Blastocatellia bacterium]